MPSLAGNAMQALGSLVRGMSIRGPRRPPDTSEESPAGPLDGPPQSRPSAVQPAAPGECGGIRMVVGKQGYGLIKEGERTQYVRCVEVIALLQKTGSVAEPLASLAVKECGCKNHQIDPAFWASAVV